MTDSEEGKFCIQGVGAFMNKQSAVFDALNSLEKNHAQFCQNEPLLVPSRDPEDVAEGIDTVGTSSFRHGPRKRSSTGESRMVRQLDNPDFGFRAPPNPRSFRQANRRVTPDHKIHPERWTKYTLADVPSDQMSEKSNTAAAMGFLRAIRQAKEAGESEMDVDGADAKPVFNKPSFHKGTELSEKPAASSGKIVMPEYIVGASRMKKESRGKSAADGRAAASKISLEHLNDYDDGNQDSGDEERMDVASGSGHLFTKSGRNRPTNMRKNLEEDE